MANQKINQSGYINSLDKAYIFTYENEFLQLVPQNKEDIKPYDFLANSDKFYEILEGKNISNQKIYFLNCNLKVSGSGYIAKPAGFICCTNELNSFKTISFSGGIIDYFYRTNQIFDVNQSNINYDSGESTIKLRSFNEIGKTCNVVISGKKAILLLSIAIPPLPEWMTVDYNLGKPKSFLRLTFEDEIKVSDFKKIYLWIYNLMVFLNFRKDVLFGNIEFGNLNDKGEVYKSAYTHIVKKDKSEIENVDSIIGYYFVDENLSELLQIINTPKLNLLFIPEKVKDKQYITPESYMITCTSFESIFNFTFPDAKIKYSKIANEVRDEFLEFISTKDEEYKGKDAKKRKEFKKYSDMIKLMDFGLAEKFIYCYSQYKALVENYEKQKMQRMNLLFENPNDMAVEFAKKRNLLMHSNLESFENVHVMAYLLAQVFIYIMIMKRAGISDNKIIQAIDKVL